MNISIFLLSLSHSVSISLPGAFSFSLYPSVCVYVSLPLLPSSVSQSVCLTVSISLYVSLPPPPPPPPIFFRTLNHQNFTLSMDFGCRISSPIQKDSDSVVSCNMKPSPILLCYMGYKHNKDLKSHYPMANIQAERRLEILGAVTSVYKYICLHKL